MCLNTNKTRYNVPTPEWKVFEKDNPLVESRPGRGYFVKVDDVSFRAVSN